MIIHRLNFTDFQGYPGVHSVQNFVLQFQNLRRVYLNVVQAERKGFD